MKKFAKVALYIGCLLIVIGVIARLGLFPIKITGYVLFPRTYLLLSMNFFLLSIALSVLPEKK